MSTACFIQTKPQQLRAAVVHNNSAPDEFAEPLGNHQAENSDRRASEVDIAAGENSSRQSHSIQAEELEYQWTDDQRQQRTAELIESHFDTVYRYAYRLSGCATLAEDLAQETFLRALRSIHQLRDDNAAVGWLLTIVRNEFNRHCKTRKQVHNVNDDVPIINSDHVKQAEEHDSVQHALQELPSEFREVVLMYYFEDKSYAEIAISLAIPIGTVMSRLSRGRGHLKQVLQADAGIDPTAEPTLDARRKESR